MLNTDFAWGIFNPFGAYGVDFFFVLSGFIILYAHYNDIGRANLTSYFKKRFIRIYPTYWVIVIPLIPLLFLSPTIGAQGTETEISVLVKSVLLIPNDTPPILGVAWTLTHEIFFYLVFGLTLLNLKPKYSIPLVISWAIISMASFAGLIHFNNFFYLDFIFSKFNLEFILGMAAAYLFIRYSFRFPWLLVISGIIGFIIAGINGEFEILPVDRVITYGFSSFLLILGAARMDLESKKKTKIPNIFLYLGNASYSIYLTHYPAIIVWSKISILLRLEKMINENVLMIIIALASLGVGCVFHSVLEKPLLNFIRIKMISKKTKQNSELPRAN